MCFRPRGRVNQTTATSTTNESVFRVRESISSEPCCWCLVYRCVTRNRQEQQQIARLTLVAVLVGRWSSPRGRAGVYELLSCDRTTSHTRTRLIALQAALHQVPQQTSTTMRTSREQSARTHTSVRATARVQGGTKSHTVDVENHSNTLQRAAVTQDNTTTTSATSANVTLVPLQRAPSLTTVDSKIHVARSLSSLSMASSGPRRRSLLVVGRSKVAIPRAQSCEGAHLARDRYRQQ